MLNLFKERHSALAQSLQQLTLLTTGEGFTDITSDINRAIGTSGLNFGLANLFCLHTSCSLTINENADPRVLCDLAAYLRALVPQRGFSPINGKGEFVTYGHDDEGPDDMPAHIRTALTATSLQFSFQKGGLLLGTWQAVYLWEHRARPHQRRLNLHLMGE
ncbi:secondary thiamine-phosphate synthase enzyme YjbQ [Cyanobium sp. WAJ14-Wanaka]|uniref:secondary thiamine-phosphate synthase enzyme YjbQ n=1 Tax=Cyanobium sp. WAJ14-Wanaka TaxID=2823725 RepID=UPI0020CC3099|nr:secondary thiamine-phosphate synthase enzyme YjbQ [Cyanobium sp. WAJ14-Wanaka]MCP9774720.1 secondary thiamine-phosphate synthase enzyme YjbQ [Cyanobium sp. WAJ14-Wanaka]